MGWTCCGLTTTCFSSSILEKLDIRQKAKTNFYTGPSECVVSLYQTKGIRSLYRGIVAMTIRDVPGYGLYILVYEWLRDYMRRYEIGDRHGAFASVMSGGFAGVISWAIMAPADMVKSLIQSDADQTKYRNLRHCILHTYRQHGIRAFYAGCGVNCIRGFPVNAVTFLVFSQIMRKLNERPLLFGLPSDQKQSLPESISFHAYMYSVGAFEFDVHMETEKETTGYLWGSK